MGEIYCGIDWAEKHHDIAVVDEGGVLLARRRIADDLTGLTELLGVLAEHAGGDTFVPVDVATEVCWSLLCGRPGTGCSR